MLLDALRALVYTAVFSLASTPADFRLAHAIGAIDVPRDGRRMHTRPIPRIGGLSLFASFAIFSMIFCKETAQALSALLLGAVLIVVIGIIDDCKSANAGIKLAFQLCASLITVITSYRDVGPVLASASIMWLLTLTNAHNFIDGLDGLCAGVSLNESVALGIILLLDGEGTAALACFVLGGACIGFSPYNSKNAKIFMGDTGSTFLGFCLGAISLQLVLSRGYIAILPLVFVFAIPLCDIFFAITRRILNKKSIFAPDRSHLHHFLADRLGHRSASIVLRLLSAALAMLGIAFYLTDFL